MPSIARRILAAFNAAARAAALLVFTHGAAPAAPAGELTQSLAGQWRFALDREDAGVKEQWFSRDLPGRIELPGILQAQGYGDEISADTPWVAALPRDMRWYLLPQYKAYTRPGNVKVPYLSQPPRHYLGAARGAGARGDRLAQIVEVNTTSLPSNGESSRRLVGRGSFPVQGSPALRIRL